MSKTAEEGCKKCEGLGYTMEPVAIHNGTQINTVRQWKHTDQNPKKVGKTDNLMNTTGKYWIYLLL